MLQAMFNGVSAIEAHQERMDVLGNNIANVNTTGYKAGRVTFQDQLSQTIQGASRGNGSTIGGTNPIQLGLGVRVGAIDTLMQQGGLQSTSKPSDMAVQGNGFFMLGDSGGVSFTRDGSFTVDNQGSLVASSTGAYVLGWQADATGKIDTTPQVTSSSKLSIPVGGLTSTAPTQTITFGGNLSADPTTNAYQRSVKIYDSKGGTHTLTMNFTQSTTAPNTWNWYALDASNPPDPAFANITTGGFTPAQPVAAVGANGVSGITCPHNSGAGYTAAPTVTLTGGGGTGATATAQIDAQGHITGFTVTNPGTGYTSPPNVVLNGGDGNSGTIQYDTSGKYIKTTGGVTLNYASTAGLFSPQTLNSDFTGTSQVVGGSTAAPTGQDGFGPGTLESFSVDPTGVISGLFSNGFSRTLGQIALSNFSNPEGLDRAGNNTFRQTTNSGVPEVGTATTGSLGKISTGYLEQSNVDLSNEFTNMIVTQRGFQANTKIVSTVDQMLNDVIQMKQG